VLDPYLSQFVLTPRLGLSIQNVRHLEFGFLLVDEDNLPRNPTKDEYTILMDIFPTQYGVGISGPFLMIYVEQLPPRPWPVTATGLPLYLTTKSVFPWEIGRPGRIRLSVLTHPDARKTASRSMYRDVINYFGGISVEISEVVWFVGCWRIRVPSTVNISSLPGTVCQTACFYLSELSEEPEDAAFRCTNPTKLDPDTSTYDPLRPGVMISSTTLLTTSGILVRDSDGKGFMTVASHGFPENDKEVRHPKPASSIVGNIARDIPFTDISLVELRNNKFENHTFQTSEEPNGVQLVGLRDPFTLRRFDS
jgi:hypothetical protein